jgi:hypothetical protein
MTSKRKGKLARRDFLRVAGLGAGLAAAASGPLASEAAASESESEEKKAQYDANSQDVKNYYRVNRY